jgi:hypothetical protein
MDQIISLNPHEIKHTALSADLLLRIIPQSVCSFDVKTADGHNDFSDCYVLHLGIRTECLIIFSRRQQNDLLVK